MKKAFTVVSFVFLIAGVSFFGCDQVKNNSGNSNGLLLETTCDAEDTKLLSNDFVNNGHKFGGKKMQSSHVAYSGKYSCEVNNSAAFGFATLVENVPLGSYLEISVWRYSTTGKGGLHVSSDKVGDLYFLEGKPIIVDSSGWEKIVVNVAVNQEIDRLKIACYNPNDTSVYFDDLSIKMYSSRPVYYEASSALNIQINDSNYSELMRFRETALFQKVISQDLKKYVKAIVWYQGDSIPVKMRFKGDWTDHLLGDKWSFRIKVGDGNAINGLKTFSIQNPNTRGFLNEWFMHRIFENLGLLNTRYDFIPVTLNGNNLGMFAMEEHFDKQLVESRSRREGPILKIDEEGFWERNLITETEHYCYNVPYYEAAAVLPFKRKRTLKNGNLKNQFLIAKDLVYQYKTFETPVEQIFDLDALASYHALFDLGGVLHGQGWHNQRMYYNPISSKLEPIAYDMYTEDVRLVERPPILGMFAENELDIPRNRFLNQSVFNQPSFQSRYYKMLVQFSDESFLEEQEQILGKELDSLNTLLGKEFGNYALNLTSFYKKAEGIRTQLPEFKKQLEAKSVDFKILKETYDDLTEREVFYSQSGLKAYTKSKDSLKTTVELVNFHMGSLTIFGYGVKNNPDSVISLSDPIQLARYTSQEYKRETTLPGKVVRLYFTLPAFTDSVFSKKVVAWAYPSTNNPRMELQRSFSINSPYYSVKGNVIRLKSKVILKNILFIPKGYIVEIGPGTHLTMGMNGGLISYSPIKALGTKHQPITVVGLKSNNHGFQVLTNGDSSVFNHVVFDGMSALGYKGWTLTGGLTVYKGKVDLTNCTFKNNTCEDAVNLINSSFTMKSCLIENTLSDGFDADFCTGTVIQTTLNKTGNDGLDFSGSTIKVIDVTILLPGDKAISGGEKSTVTIEKTNIKGATFGVVSKDNSVVSVRESQFHFCQHVFACYQKKDEYGPAVILSNDTKKYESKGENLVGKGCFIMVDDKKQDQVNLFDIDALYGI